MLGCIQESPLVVHRVLVPPGLSGVLTGIVVIGEYTVEDEIIH
jgi:vacuolar-type H+-ATPase catalytic subunit A/Vma1